MRSVSIVYFYTIQYIICFQDNSKEGDTKDKDSEPDAVAPESNTANADDEGQDRPASPEDVKQNIKQKFLLEMPEDFYTFWDFAKTIQPGNPNGKLGRFLLYYASPKQIFSTHHVMNYFRA